MNRYKALGLLTRQRPDGGRQGRSKIQEPAREEVDPMDHLKKIKEPYKMGIDVTDVQFVHFQRGIHRCIG